MTATSTSQNGRHAAPAKGASPDEIERDIVQTRERLGGTVDALAAKADVKTRTQQRVTLMRHEQPMALAGSGAGLLVVVAAVGFLVWSSRRG